MIGEYNVQKESSLNLIPRKGAVAPKSVAPGGESADEDEDEEDGEESEEEGGEHGGANTLFARATTASSAAILRTPALRVQPHTGERESARRHIPMGLPCGQYGASQMTVMPSALKYATILSP